MELQNSSPQIVSSLKLIKEWLEDLIATDKVQLKRPSKDNRVSGYELVAPAVHIGLVPPNGILDESAGIRIPCLAVGIEEANGDADETRLALRITAIVYDPGTQSAESGGAATLTPNFDGYTTLLNFMDRVKAWILREDGAAGCFALEGGVKLTPYEEQPWPYWYGALTFAVSGGPYAVTKYADALN